MAGDKSGDEVLDRCFYFSYVGRNLLEISIGYMRKALVIGLGLSGQAAAEFLLRKGYAVIGVDSNLKALGSPGVKRLEEKGLSPFLDTDVLGVGGIELAVISPGVPASHPLYLQVIAAGAEAIGEAELALRHLDQPCIGITGTNGKTTVTMLVEHVLRGCGKKARALGNVGSPLTSYALSPDPEEILVVELSSYQLETMQTPIFNAGVILNITPDHLDRYNSMDEYAQAKCRLQQCMKNGAPLYIYEQIPHEFGHFLKSPYQTYAQSQSHESENALAARLLCKEFEISREQFYRTLETFKKPPHRIELVKIIDGISYIDDSKGTNIDAVVRAVDSCEGPVILIAGGVDKGASYQPWKKAFASKVKKIIVIGQAADKIAHELKDVFIVEIAQSLEQAVMNADLFAQRGDSVLLSPGCSSFDMFRDYAHRGEEFKRYVNQIEERRRIR